MRESESVIGIHVLRGSGKGGERERERKMHRKRGRKINDRQCTLLLAWRGDLGGSPPAKLVFRVFLCAEPRPTLLALLGHWDAKSGKLHRHLLGNCNQRFILKKHVIRNTISGE